MSSAQPSTTTTMTLPECDVWFRFTNVVDAYHDWEYVDDALTHLEKTSLGVTDYDDSWKFTTAEQGIDVAEFRSGYGLSLTVPTETELVEVKAAEAALHKLGIMFNTGTEQANGEFTRWWYLDEMPSELVEIKDEAQIAGHLQFSQDEYLSDYETQAGTALEETDVTFDTGGCCWQLDWSLSGAVLIGIGDRVALEIPLPDETAGEVSESLREAEIALGELGLEFECETTTTPPESPYEGRVRRWYLSDLPEDRFQIDGELRTE